MPQKGDSHFQDPGEMFRRLARTTDPETSREAGDRIVHSDSLARKRGQLVALVGNNPGKTASELQRIYERQGNRGHLWKRVKGCVEVGLIRRGKARECTVTKRMAATLWPVEEQV